MNRLTNKSKKRPSKKVLACRLNAAKKRKQVEVGLNVEHEVAGRDNMKATASSSKLSLFSRGKQVSDNQLSSEYVLVHKDVWKNIFMRFSCTDCGSQDLNIAMPEEMGFVSKLEVKCPSCEKCYVDTYTSPRVSCESSRPPFTVNRQMVEAFLSMGKGHAGMEQFCVTMGMNCMSSSTYNSHLLECYEDSQLLQAKVLNMAHSVVRQAHLEANPDLDENDVIDISVSYDGTWHKRGHTSNYGIGIVIDVLTGLVIDFQVMSKYCGTCVMKSSAMGKDSIEYAGWLQNHKESGMCEANYSGSSNSMEAAAAVEMWKRSIDLNKLRYTTIISDGDSKTHQQLQMLAVYGPDIQITKDECLNHIAKRLGTGLRNKVRELKIKGTVLGGKRPGSLTEGTIVKLTNYYRSAIKKNIPNVEQMKTAVFATLYHCMSTDQLPQHFKCPGGEMSWCFYNRALAKGEDPPKHEGNRNTFLLPHVVAAVVPVYQRLASNELLERCTKGKTQNSNESVHSVIWKKCPKETFVSKKKIEIAVVSAIGEFNMGCEVNQIVKEKLKGKRVSVHGRKISEKRDVRRLQESTRHSKSTYRTSRKRLKYAKTAQEEAKKKAEGPTYGAGQF